MGRSAGIQGSSWGVAGGAEASPSRLQPLGSAPKPSKGGTLFEWASSSPQPSGPGAIPSEATHCVIIVSSWTQGMVSRS